MPKIVLLTKIIFVNSPVFYLTIQNNILNLEPFRKRKIVPDFTFYLLMYVITEVIIGIFYFNNYKIVIYTTEA